MYVYNQNERYTNMNLYIELTGSMGVISSGEFGGEVRNLSR